MLGLHGGRTDWINNGSREPPKSLAQSLPHHSGPLSFGRVYTGRASRELAESTLRSSPTHLRNGDTLRGIGLRGVRQCYIFYDIEWLYRNQKYGSRPFPSCCPEIVNIIHHLFIKLDRGAEDAATLRSMGFEVVEALGETQVVAPSSFDYRHTHCEPSGDYRSEPDTRDIA